MWLPATTVSSTDFNRWKDSRKPQSILIPLESSNLLSAVYLRRQQGGCNRRPANLLRHSISLGCTQWAIRDPSVEATKQYIQHKYRRSSGVVDAYVRLLGGVQTVRLQFHVEHGGREAFPKLQSSTR
jgi:hypothetical protein